MTGSPHRILVTGAGGFVGSWLVHRLNSALPAGSEITATGRRANDPMGIVSLDITRTADVDAIVDRLRPTCVVHLAGVSSLVQAQADARKVWDINLFGTMNLADAVMRFVPESRFIFASSSEVYGGSFNRVEGSVDETALLDPTNPYASTKAAADLMLGQMAEAGLRSVRFRPFNHTGPGQSTRFAVSAFASQIAAAERGEGPAVLRVGNLEARRDFLDVRDVVEAYRLAVVTPDPPRKALFNLASGVARRMGDILDALIGMSDLSISVEHDEDLMRPSDVPVTRGDASLAMAVLGWRPMIEWNSTLRHVLDSHRRVAP